MEYTVYLVIAPVLAYLVYEDWKDAAKHRSEQIKKH